MTTIAFRNGVLASDSACTWNMSHVHGMRKIYRLRDGSLFGFSGHVSRALRWLEWADTDSDEPEPSLKEVHLIRADGHGVWFVESGQVMRPKPSGYFAIGSGSDFALGAMANGAGAVAAVRAACKHDALSRGPVVSLKLTTWEKRL